MRSELENLIYFASFIDAEGYVEYTVRPKKNQKGHKKSRKAPKK